MRKWFFDTLVKNIMWTLRKIVSMVPKLKEAFDLDDDGDVDWDDWSQFLEIVTDYVGHAATLVNGFEGLDDLNKLGAVVELVQTRFPKVKTSYVYTAVILVHFFKKAGAWLATYYDDSNQTTD